MEEIRQFIERIWPKIQEYLEKEKPEYIPIYYDYYLKVINEKPEIASEYAYRILRLYSIIVKG
jgi:hypothetical protein